MKQFIPPHEMSTREHPGTYGRTEKGVENSCNTTQDVSLELHTETAVALPIVEIERVFVPVPRPQQTRRMPARFNDFVIK